MIQPGMHHRRRRSDDARPGGGFEIDGEIIVIAIEHAAEVNQREVRPRRIAGVIISQA
jgi:hypothetical protein